MAERSQLQYQPVTGPVWREPVAEKMAWLPQGQQPARALEYRRVGDFQQPPFAALYAPAGIQWQPEDGYSGRPLARARFDCSVYPIQVTAAAYNPVTLEWTPDGAAPQIAIERRRVGDFAQPPFQALYKAEGLQWQPAGKATPTPVERRALGDFQQPAYDSLFKPELLSWEPSDRYAGRAIAFSVQSRFLLDPFPPAAVPYDPAFLMWRPMGASYPQAPIERRIVGDFQQPPFDTSSPTPAPSPTFVELPAGRRHRRTLYRVTIDDEVFEFKSYEAACDFLNKAKEAAQELADRTLEQAILAQRQTPVEIPLPTMPMPVITASTRELRSEITKTKREIAQVYEQATRNIETALMLELVLRERDNEDIILWLH